MLDADHFAEATTRLRQPIGKIVDNTITFQWLPTRTFSEEPATPLYYRVSIFKSDRGAPAGAPIWTSPKVLEPWRG